MPIIANAKKALRQSKVKAARNQVVRAKVRNLVKKADNNADAAVVSQLYSVVDRAAKKNILHKNKAARLKARAAKAAKNAATSTPATTKTVAKSKKAAKKKPTKVKKTAAKSKKTTVSKK
jgi:small subunit ribosomal protein S20